MGPPSLPSLGPELWSFPLVAGAPLPSIGPPIHRLSRNAPAEESTVTEPSAVVGKARRKRRDTASSKDDSSRAVSTSGGHGLMDNDTKRLKRMDTDENDNMKTEVEASSGMYNTTPDQNSQPSEPTKQDYIHVRARRGQATDNHSLAERARRKKISERMEILQDLVPGCNKVIGKASILDEIINYIQALQRQVEFLSLKLEAVSSRMNSSFEVFPHKDLSAQAQDPASSLPFAPQATREHEQDPAGDWLHMQVGVALERVT